MPTPQNDLFARAGGLNKLGETLTEFVMLYRSVMDPTKAKETPPPYVRDLLGKYTIPSMYLKLPGDHHYPTPVNREERPFNVARVIHDIHRQYMGMLRNITLKTTRPEEIMARELQKPGMAQAIEHGFQDMVYQAIATKTPQIASTQADQLITFAAIAEMIAGCQSRSLPTLAFDLKNTSTGEVLPVTDIPNIMVHHKKTPHIRGTELPIGIPLACIAWGLDKATRGKLLADPANYFITFFAGTQEGLTISMVTLLDAIQRKMPAGKSVNDYLVMDGPALTKVIQEEAHPIQVWRAMDVIEGNKTKFTDNLLSFANVSPSSVSLDKPESAGRDVACLLYATAKEFDNVAEDIRKATKDPRLQSVGRKLREENKYSTTMQAMIAELKTIADKSYQCRSKDDVVNCLQEKRHSAVLKDALKRAGI